MMPKRIDGLTGEEFLLLCAAHPVWKGISGKGVDVPSSVDASCFVEAVEAGDTGFEGILLRSDALNSRIPLCRICCEDTGGRYLIVLSDDRPAAQPFSLPGYRHMRKILADSLGREIMFLAEFSSRDGDGTGFHAFTSDDGRVLIFLEYGEWRGRLHIRLSVSIRKCRMPVPVHGRRDDGGVQLEMFDICGLDTSSGC